jgi:hypothetical protein
MTDSKPAVHANVYHNTILLISPDLVIMRRQALADEHMR